MEADDAADLEAVDRGDGKRGVADGGVGGYFGDGEALGSEGEGGARDESCREKRREHVRNKKDGVRCERMESCENLNLCMERGGVWKE